MRVPRWHPALPPSAANTIALALACTLSSSCFEETDAPAELGSVSEEVVRGNAVVAHPSAGALQRSFDDNTPVMICSGTLIGCDTFLTAAHCVCESDIGDPCAIPTPASELSVFFQHAGTVAVEAVYAHEDFSFPRADVAVLRLAEPVVGIRPAPLLRDNPAIDAVLTIVGFGMTFKNGPDVGLKREGVLQRAACSGNRSDEDFLCFEPEESPTVSCNGDSGGPNYFNVDGVEHVAGIVAGGGTDDSCQSRQKFATLVARHLDFIDLYGGQFGQERCGPIAQAEDASGAVSDDLGVGNNRLYSVYVPPGTAELRIGANAVRGSFLDLAERFGGEPDSIVDRCDEGLMSAYCQIDSPAVGEHHVLVRNDSEHQVAMTTLGGAPIARPDVYEVIAGEPLHASKARGVLSNDLDGRGLPLRVELVAEPLNGRLTLDDDGSFDYRPRAGFIGGDSFAYRVVEEGGEGEEGRVYSAQGQVEIQIRTGGSDDLGCRSSGRGSSWLAGVFLLVCAWRRSGAARGRL